MEEGQGKVAADGGVGSSIGCASEAVTPIGRTRP
jgi:hypothetical protein